MANNRGFIQKALGLFSAKGDGGRIEPDNPLIHKVSRGFHLPDYTPLSQLWEWYLQGCLNDNDDLRCRRNRYEDLDFMVKNSPLVKAAVDLFADEAAQCDTGSCPVRVKAKRDAQNYISDLLDEWGVTQQTVREIIWNKVLFGDAFEVNDARPKEGIVRVTPVTVWDVADRLEFDPSKVMEKMRYGIEAGQDNGMKLAALMADLSGDGENPSSYFNKYLLGFELNGGRMTPPWGVTHYRAFSMLREFAPWGRSRFINVLPQFRQLVSAEGLMQVARAASFPRDVYQVSTEPGSTATERWSAMEEFQEQLDNAGMTQGSRELPAIGSRIIMPKELADFQSFKSDIDVDAISDVEYLRDNLIMGLMIPKGYLIADSGNWGVSGQSLLQQFKPFGRLVFSDQSDYMAGLMEKIKIHLALAEKFDGWDTPFELEMEFPVIEETSERTQHKAEELTLANNVVDTLKNVLGVERVPPEIVKDAFGMLTSIPQAKVDDYVDRLVKFNKDDEADGGDGAGRGWGNDDSDGLGFGGGVKSDVNPAEDMRKTRGNFSEQYRRARARWTESLARDEAMGSLIRLKAECRFYEGRCDGRHYLSSMRDSGEMRKDRMVIGALKADMDGGRAGLRARKTARQAGVGGVGLAAFRSLPRALFRHGKAEIGGECSRSPQAS